MTLKHSHLAPEVEQVGHKIIGGAIEVHRQLGPGFKEPVYSEALCLEKNSIGLSFEREKPIVIRYIQWAIAGHRLDLVVEGVVVVELKAVARIKELHRRQLVSYLKASQLQLGLLLNFNVTVLRAGIRRVIL